MPRPLRRLRGLADPQTVRRLRAAAKRELGMSDRAAGAMSTMWVDPDQILTQLANPRRMRIPGGDIHYIDGEAWTPRLVPDVTNPRIANKFTYPVAGADAEGSEVFPTEVESGKAELILKVSSPEDLRVALDRAMEKTRTENKPFPPIGQQGIMDAPFGVITEIEFADGSAGIAVAGVREGSSRTAHAQQAVGCDAEDVLFRMTASAKPMREFVAEINAILDQPAASTDDRDRAKVRCATTNFILIVGFTPDVPGTLDLEEAIKVKVAQEHLNTKADWDQEAGDSVLADDCLRAVFRADLLKSDDEYRWLAGQLTRDEADELGLEENQEDRFAHLIWLFTTMDDAVHEAIRRPIAFVLRNGEDRQVQVRRTTKLPYAVELTARELRGVEPYSKSAIDRISRLMINGGGVAMVTSWKPTSRGLAALTRAALADAESGQLGRSSAELAVRALYYVSIYDVLHIARNDQGASSDRRKIADVLHAMAVSRSGVRVLADIIRDGRRGIQPYLRDDAGQPVESAEGGTSPLTNEMIRYRLFPKGGVDQDDEVDPFVKRQRAVQKALDTLEINITELEALTDDDSISVVNTRGLPMDTATKWKAVVSDAAAKFDRWFVTGVGYRASGTRPAIVINDASDDEAAG